MSDAHKHLSLADLALPPKRGRPKSGNALSNSAKQKLYRERKKADGAVVVTLTHEDLSILTGVMQGLIHDDPSWMDIVRMHSGTQLKPLHAKLAQMAIAAQNKASDAINRTSPIKCK